MRILLAWGISPEGVIDVDEVQEGDGRSRSGLLWSVVVVVVVWWLWLCLRSGRMGQRDVRFWRSDRKDVTGMAFSTDQEKRCGCISCR